MKKVLAVLSMAIAFGGCQVTVVPGTVTPMVTADSASADSIQTVATRGGGVADQPADSTAKPDHRPPWAQRPHDGGRIAQPPGLAKRDSATMPPGQAKKDDGHQNVPPGQAKKDDGHQNQPPGQATRANGNDKAGEHGKPDQAGQQKPNGNDKAAEHGKSDQAGQQNPKGNDKAGGQVQQDKAGQQKANGNDKAGEHGKPDQAGQQQPNGNQKAGGQGQAAQSGQQKPNGNDKAGEHGKPDQASQQKAGGNDKAGGQGQPDQAGQQKKGNGKGKEPAQPSAPEPSQPPAQPSTPEPAQPSAPEPAAPAAPTAPTATIAQLLGSDAMVGQQVQVTGACLAKKDQSAEGPAPKGKDDWQLGSDGAAIWVVGAEPAACAAGPVTIVARVAQDQLPSHGKKAGAVRRYLSIE